MGIGNVEQKLDDAVQTAQDYSLVVNDPPSHATDPDTWYNFFNRFGNVMNITIAKNNKKLCQLLLQKHILKRRIHNKKTYEQYSSMSHRLNLHEPDNNKAWYIPYMQKIGLCLDEDYYICKLIDINTQIEDACKLTYVPAR